VAKLPPQLVLLPGLDGTGDLFRALLDELPLGYNRSVVRYPTHLSSYADLAPVVRSAIPEIPAYVLLAESFSTPLAIQVISTHPGYIRGLILVCGFASSPVRGMLRAAAHLAAPWLISSEVSEFAVRRFLVGSDASPDLVNQVHQAVRQVPSRVLADRLRAVVRCDVRTELRQIQVPILCLQSSNDRLVRPACAREIRALAQREESKLVVIDGPHMLLQRQPGPCVDAIADFLHHAC
jgi:pimeloyl-ACP methyl ester carboxylesterase